MKKNREYNILIYVMIIIILTASIPYAKAASTWTSYTLTVNSKTITVTTSTISHSTAAGLYSNSCKNYDVGSGKHVCCAGYAASLYKYLWGTSFSQSVTNNMLSNLTLEQRRISVDNLKWFFANAKSGADVRFDKSTTLSRSDYGHELIYLGYNSSTNLASFWEGNYDGAGGVRIWNCTWAELYKRFNDKGYIYMPYIIYPNATKLTAPTSPKQILSLNNIVYPNPYKINQNGYKWGSGSGTITAKDGLASVIFNIYDQNGNCVAHYENNQSVNTLVLENITDKINMSALTVEGTSVFEIIARDINGNKLESAILFTASNSQATVNKSFSREYQAPSLIGSISYGSSDYYLYNASYSWSDAQNFASFQGGYLATIANSEENAAVAAMLSSRSITGAWIGGCESGGQFVWANGESMTYTNWAVDQPSRTASAENYIEIYGTRLDGKREIGEWNDGVDKANSINHFIVEIPIAVNCDHSDTEINIVKEAHLGEYGLKQRQCVICEEILKIWAYYESIPVIDNCDFCLPYYLKTIEEEAFEGISAVHIKIGYQAEFIGKRAFANCVNLQQIFIPRSVVTIDEDAFGEKTDFMIMGYSGTAAESFAKEQGIQFVIMDAYSSWVPIEYFPANETMDKAKTQYRYRDKVSTDGYTEWSDWTDWSAKLDLTPSDLIEEESKERYRWWAAKCTSCGQNNPYHGSSVKCQKCGITLYNNQGLWESVFAYSDDTSGQQTIYNRKGKYIDGKPYWPDSDPVVTQYRYRVRNYIMGWSEWSDWSDAIAYSSDTREVETRIMGHIQGD